MIHELASGFFVMVLFLAGCATGNLIIRNWARITQALMGKNDA